ncbi:alpha-amylase/4-alpha-glucanotransferase domain-containing protein [Candidatus Omnitrophota bacterium]
MQNQDKKLNLLMAVHCHQPVSNFAGVFQNAYEKAYLPFLDVFEDFSNIKISLHYSGSLLDWLVGKHPEFIERLKVLIKENRIEIIGGGYFEPIFTMIPFRDAVGQITMFKERIKEIFSQDCKGIWLSERVWEPRLPYILTEAGAKFTIVDDCHFKSSHKNIEQLNGYYLCEEELRTISIFPGSERLRYLLPFKLPAEAISYLRERLNQGPGDLTITFADDGEKFGLWPGTNKWVYRENWLKNYFTALEENKSWINTLTFSEFIKMSGPTDRVYLPCSSYREMQEWSGGFFRNFFVKYPEANNMQKKMFLISDRFNELKKKHDSKPDILALIKKHLYMGQFNDTYWHGIFGGLYLTHLRSGAYENLIKAENLIEEIEKHNDKIIQCDYDRDGKSEFVVFNKRMRLYFRPEEGATISEWDDKTRCLNLTNTISRRFESYHEKLTEKLNSVPNSNETSPKSIHDQKTVREAELDKILFYDIYPRYSLRDYLLAPETKLDDFYKCKFKELVRLGNSPYEFRNKSNRKKHVFEFSRKENIDSCVINITKKVTIVDNLISVDYCLENSGTGELGSIFGTEFNLSLYDSKFCTAVNEEDGVFNFVVNDLWKGAEIDFSLSPNARVWRFPVETVSDSEQGIEKTYQELCLFFNWPISLTQSSKFKLKLELKLS